MKHSAKTDQKSKLCKQLQRDFEGRGQIKWRIKSHTSNSLLILVFLLLRCLGSNWQRIDGIRDSAASDSLWIWLSTRTGVRDNRESLVAHSPRPFNGQKKTSRLGANSAKNNWPKYEGSRPNLTSYIKKSKDTQIQ